MNPQHVTSIVGTTIAGSGFAGFWIAADPYVKCILAVLTAIAAITTIIRNTRKP